MTELTETLWNERFRPKKIEDCILPKPLKHTFENFVVASDCPNIMIHSSSGGTGKTTVLRALCSELDLEYLFINASEQRSVDVIRNDVTQFVSTMSLEGRKKAVIFDECLADSEEIVIGPLDNKQTLRLSEFEENRLYLMVSYNLRTHEEEEDVGVIVSSKDAEVFKITFEDGREILVTDNHPFFVYSDVDTFIEKSLKDGLNKDDFILSTYTVGHSLVKLQSVSPVGVRKVRNLRVMKNHNFFTRSGILTHNCDSQTPIAQQALRSFIEQFSHIRFFFSCNFVDKVIQPLQSRCTVITFDWPASEHKYLKNQFYARVKDILNQEHIPFNKDVVVELIKRFFPDFRRIINELQKQSITGVIDEGVLVYSREFDLTELMDILKAKKFNELRKWVETNETLNYELFYRNFYKEIAQIAAPSVLPSIILILGRYMFQHSSVYDKQINLLCCMIEVMAELVVK